MPKKQLSISVQAPLLSKNFSISPETDSKGEVVLGALPFVTNLTVSGTNLFKQKNFDLGKR